MDAFISPPSVRSSRSSSNTASASIRSTCTTSWRLRLCTSAIARLWLPKPESSVCPLCASTTSLGRIGYLRELEDKYELGYGIHATPLPNSNPQLVPQLNNSTSNKALREQPSGPEAMYEIVESLVAMDPDERRTTFQQRCQKMLSEKIDCAKFLTYFIENYPQSVEETKTADESFWKRFK